jgi:polyhydroxyalkanoate synthase
VLARHGVEVGRTPSERVWSRGRTTLHRYRLGERGHRTPVLIVYALILRPYVLDLVPGTSLVELLARRGLDVFLLDFGRPTGADRDRGLEDYALDDLGAALAVVRSTTGTEGATLLGHCQGGTLAAIHAALRPDGAVRNLVLLAAPIDFAPGRPRPLHALLSQAPVVVPALGNLPADLPSRALDAGSRALERGWRLVGARLPPWWRDEQREALEPWLGVCRWVDDGVPFPARALREWLGGLYVRNRLVHGELELGGQRVDLGRVRCPVLNIAGTGDLVTPRPQTRRTLEVMNSEDAEELVLHAGHLGMLLAAAGRRELWPKLADWIVDRSA